MDVAPPIWKPEWQIHAYPPYHTGLYMEDFFHDFYENWARKPRKMRYIGISWTMTYHIPGGAQNLQRQFLNSLVRGKEPYFTVCQHDEGPGRNTLPANTLVFSAGGLYKGPNVVPIPLVCAGIPDAGPGTPKDLLASFVGSDTHPLRQEMCEVMGKVPNVELVLRPCAGNFLAGEVRRYLEVMSRSRFTLAPRGYGTTSFRLYEAMQYGSVPVYVSDEHWLPYKGALDWANLAIIVRPDQVRDLPDILAQVDEDRRLEMVNYAQSVYKDHFTLAGMSRRIMDYVMDFDATLVAQEAR